MRRYLVLAVFGTVICWVAWVIVLFNIDPTVSGFIGLASFYSSFFCALLGTFSLLGFAIRRVVSRDRVAFRSLGVSIRQGLFLSMLLVGALLLRGTGFYTWWNLLFLIGAITLLEFFFLTRESA
jgi:hypothetical protein